MLRKLKARRDALRARAKQIGEALRKLRKVRIPKGARKLGKRLRARMRGLRQGQRQRLRKVVDRIKRVRKRRDRRINTSPGHPHWGGSRDIIEREVIPVAERFGVPVTSRKRPANHPLSVSNPGSDHNEANTLAYAVDLGTYSGEQLAHAIAKAMGISGYRTGSYTYYHVQRQGHTYRVQILWAVSGHWDHVHVGVRRVS